MTQNNLALALYDQAQAADRPERAKKMSEAIAAMHAALEVFTDDATPEHHAQGVKWITEVEDEIAALNLPGAKEKSTRKDSAEGKKQQDAK